MSLRRFLRCQAVVLCAFPPFACAQAQSGDAVQPLPPVQVTGRLDGTVGAIDLDATPTSASRLGLRIRELPASAYQIDRGAIEAAGARDTQEILRGIPGMTAVQAQGGAAGFVTYRGFSGSQLTQLFNGIAIQYDVVSARPIDNWIVDRVEVIGGPSSFLFGAGAVGGSINTITKLPQRYDFADAQVRGGSFGLLQGAVGINRRLAGAASDGHFLRIDASALKKNSYIDGEATRSQQVAASLLSDLGSRLTHTLALEFQHEDQHRPYFGTPLLNPATGEGRFLEDAQFKNYNSADGQYEQTVKWGRSILEYRIADAARVTNTLYAYDALRDYRNVEEYAFDASNTRVVRFSPLLQRHDQTLVGDRIEATFEGSLLGHRSDWAVGADYGVNRQTRFPKGPVLDVSTVDPVNFTTGNFFDETGIMPGFVPDREVKVRTLAFFVENRTKIFAPLSLVTGLRRDRIDLTLANRGAVSAANPAQLDKGYGATTGRVGLLWEPVPGASLYAQYATAADPPAGILTTTSFAQARTNTELTTGRQVEVGAKADLLDRRATFTIAAYRIIRRNLATTDPNNRLATILVGQQSARGIELSAEFRLTPQLGAWGNAAFVDPKYDDFSQAVGTSVVSRAGNVPPNTPKRVINAGVNYAFAPAWRATAVARHVSKVQGNIANTLTAPGYTLVDVGLAYRFNSNAAVTGRLRNVFDKRYVAYVSATPLFYLGESRAADVTLRVTF